MHMPLKSAANLSTRLMQGKHLVLLVTIHLSPTRDFERNCFIISRDLIFEETEFPKASDFDEPPADFYDDSRRSPQAEQILEPSRTRPIYDEIIVLPPPALEVFATYGPDFQQDDDPAICRCNENARSHVMVGKQSVRKFVQSLPAIPGC